jgi:type II secretory pathway component PulF
MNQQQFQYKAVSAEGQPVAGLIEAIDIDQALAALTAQGLRSAQVVLLAAATPVGAAALRPAATTTQLSAAALEQLAEHLEMLAKSGLPLPQGLRVAAEESTHANLAQVLRDLASQVELGRSLDDVLAAQPQVVPQHVSRLIEAGLRSGKLAEVLTESLEIEQDSREMWRTVRRAVSYPLLVLVAYIVVLAGLAIFVLPGLADLFDQMPGLPWTSHAVISFTGQRLFLVLAAALAAVPLMWLILRACSPVFRYRLLAKIPFLGPMFYWSSVATWTRLLSLLLRNGVAAPEALRLAARGIRDANVARESHQMARQTIVGRNFTDALAAASHLPPSLVPIARWGEQADALPEALRVAGEMLESRVRIRALFLQSALPPMVFVLIGMGTLTLMNALLAPMIAVINSFSSW